MINFKHIELSDRTWITALIKTENSRSADFSFGNMYMWDKTYSPHVAELRGRLIAKPRYQSLPFFAFPIGSGSLDKVIYELRENAAEQGIPFIIRGATKDHIQLLNGLYPGKFIISEERAYFDYIYLAEKLASLSGKKLHAKRNHINRFIESNDWSFEPLTPALIAECLEMLDGWELSDRENWGIGLEAEHSAIIRGFSSFEELGLEGGVLRSDGRVIAFTAGEMLCSDTFDIHFEKAYTGIQGAYQMINREFARLILQNHPEVTYINREDDMGQENLRRAKMSYYPEFLIEKHQAIWRD